MSGFAEVLVEFTLTSQGGRESPISLGEDASPHYMPHFVVHNGDGTYLGVEFVDGPEEPVLPGGCTYATVRFIYEPEVSYSALVEGASFDIREGDRTVGSGRVTRL
jgi:translation elongation factor EF-Tu-like GTPase